MIFHMQSLRTKYSSSRSEQNAGENHLSNFGFKTLSRNSRNATAASGFVKPSASWLVVSIRANSIARS